MSESSGITTAYSITCCDRHAPGMQTRLYYNTSLRRLEFNGQQGLWKGKESCPDFILKEKNLTFKWANPFPIVWVPYRWYWILRDREEQVSFEVVFYLESRSCSCGNGMERTLERARWEGKKEEGGWKENNVLRWGSTVVTRRHSPTATIV